MEPKRYDYLTIEQKWQQQWFQHKINIAQKKHNKKFFIHFAYPGVSGYLHVGHMRGFTYSDIISRYKIMTGHDVLFPAGFHASGIPSVGFAKKVERNDPETINLLKQNSCSNELIEKLKDPQEVVNYFSKVYVEEYWKRFGFLIDYSRQMTTISPGYKHFITWQFHQLNKKQLLIQKPHYAPYCKNCGPVAVDKSETDVSQGGSAEILDFTIIKFTMNDGTILPAATLRPETIFGVTNMWINPDVSYQKVQFNDETWICSSECIAKLQHQYNNVKPINEKIKGNTLLGKTCTVPLVNREVPILPGKFADPKIATGIVMSVPAHAPYDWIALVDAKADIQPITIIDVKGFGDNPAKEACNQLNIKNQTETQKLDEATELVYKKEFHTGVLNHHCGDYAGIKISEIKDEVKDDLIYKNLATPLKEFSEEVICRCKENVIIKQIPDQWFIKYSDETLTLESQAHAETMNIHPQEYKDELPKILDWYDDRAAIRKGSWLGTEFPYKKEWIIEPISDSTLYPTYYIISKYVNEQQINPEEMDDNFFDYIFLGKGTPKNKTWEQIKEDFDYWYPVDINLGGKEHKTVHFPVYIMNHVALLPPEKRAQGLFVHWWVTQQGKEKISKSKGGAEPILQAAQTYSVDAMRLYYTHVGSPYVDIEWDPEAVIKYKNRIANIWKQTLQLQNKKHTTNKNIDQWLQSILHRRITSITEAFEQFDLRTASNEIYFELQKDLQWYLKRNGSNTELLKKFISTWIKMMTPTTPHLAEELWHKLGNTTFISLTSFPQPETSKISEEAEAGEHLLAEVISDINEIIKVTKITPQKICIYTSAQWKNNILQQAIQQNSQGSFNVSNAIKQLMTDPKMKLYGKEILQYVGKLAGELKKMGDRDKKRYLIQLNEHQYLTNAREYLQQQFNCSIEIFHADDQNKHDPANKARFAIPQRPAIYIT